MKPLDIAGKKYGRISVIKKTGTSSNGKVLWECQCDCGKIIFCDGTRLKSGHTSSCGCLKRDYMKNPVAAISHGNSRGGKRSREYTAWKNMRNRCQNPNVNCYHNYGGRGISVCDRWNNSFELFLSDMGKCPPGYSIERKENNGNYEPLNCHWASGTVQARNRRTNVWIEFSAGRITIVDAAIALSVKYNWLYWQIKKRHRALDEIIASLGMDALKIHWDGLA